MRGIIALVFGGVVLGACVSDEPAGTSASSSGSVDNAPVCDGKTACGRLLFVTSASYTGDLGGMQGADAKCQEAAQKSTLAFVRKRTFMAWLGTLITNPTDRLTNGSGEYRRTDGVVVAASFADLVANKLKAPPNRDENGAEVGGSVWTGTDNKGTGTTHECAVFSEARPDGSGLGGTAGKTDEGWATGVDLPCNTSARLYCFEK